MQIISETLTALVFTLSSLALGSAAQAHGYSEKPTYRSHGYHHYHVPRYPSRPHIHTHYQHKHRGVYKKHRHD